MPAKEILAALRELGSTGWRIQLTNGRAHAYARAYCPGGEAGCPPLTVYGTHGCPSMKRRESEGQWGDARMERNRNRKSEHLLVRP